MKPVYSIKPNGDSALSVVFETEISERVNNLVAALKEGLESSHIEGFHGCIPTYCSLLIQYDPLRITYEAWRELVDGLMGESVSEERSGATVYVIPVLYKGLDLEHVADANRLTSKEVVEIHTAPIYRIYMLGFTPGFPYLGGMDERIATPRLSQPRTKIAAGSVGIAGKQTGIYPIDSPGGWQIIGNTPVKLFDAKSVKPVLLEAGGYIQFKSVSEEEYSRIEELVTAGNYTCETYCLGRGGL